MNAPVLDGHVTRDRSSIASLAELHLVDGGVAPFVEPTMLATETTIKTAVAAIVPRTEGVRVGWDVRVGRDSTDEEAVWVYVLVPDARIDEFYEEWAELRGHIRERVRDEVGNAEVFVYIRMLAASEVDADT